MIKRIPTEVPRFDFLTDGGLFTGGLYVVQGPPGIGKTILANQICFTHARNDHNSLYVTFLGETSSRMISYMSSMKFFNQDHVGTKIHFITGFKELKDSGVTALLEMLKKSIKELKIKFVVLDGLDRVEATSKSEMEFNEFLHNFQSYCGLLNCTAFLLTPKASRDVVRPEHAISDGIIELNETSVGPRSVREIQVFKFRGSNFLKGKHEFEINALQGFVVHPRTEVQFSTPVNLDEGIFERRMMFGIPKFDEMLHGGVWENSITTLYGAPGTGKTTLGMSFLLEGAKNGEHGIYFGFYENPARLIAKAKAVNIGLQKYVDSGLIELQWQQAVENSADALAEQLLERMKSQREYKLRIFIDGMAGFRRALPYPERFGSFLTAFCNELRNLGATCLITEEADIFSENVIMPNKELGSVVDNVIFLRYIELRSQLYRLISIMKVRESSYDSSIREFVITKDGVEVAATFESAELVLSGHGRLLSPMRPSKPSPASGVSPKERKTNKKKTSKKQKR